MGRRYTLTTRLEEGALAELYKAQADGPGASDVLVKLFNPRFSDPAFAKALGEIGTRAFSLGHPQALGYDEVGIVGGRIAAVRAHVDGFNLGDALRRLMSKEVVLPPALALFIVAEAAQIVAAAHLQDWAHGAITPGNILLGFDGKVRVVDFGALEAMSYSPALKAMAAKGRNAYRAPEQKSPGAGKPAGDVYSLGAIVYELLTLREVAQSRGGGLSTKRDSLPAPSRVDRRLNARMDPVVMRALELAPSRRYRSALEMSEALRGLFSVLGYAPGVSELVKFVKDLFPNEVTIGGIGGELPIKGAFSLDTVFAEVPAAQQEGGFDFADRISYTTSAVDNDPTTEDAPVAPEPPRAAAPAAPAAAEPDDFEDWEAPPGIMPEAPRLARNVQRPEPGPAPVAAASATIEMAKPEPAPRAVRKATPPSVPARDTAEQPTTTPVETPAVDDEDSGLAPANQSSTTHDWHLPPAPPPEEPERPRVGMGVWLFALVAFAILSAVVFVAMGRKLGVEVPTKPPDISLKPLTDVQPAPETTKAIPLPAKEELPARAKLTLEANVPASVIIDGRDTGKKTPLVGYELPAGKHTVLLVHKRLMKEFTLVLEPGAEEKRVETLGARQKNKRRPRGKRRN